MINESEFANYDDTPLKFEETTEMFYLDKNAKVGKLLPVRKWHDTDLEEMLPDDFLYDIETDVLDTDSYEWAISYQFSSDFRNPYQQGKGQYGNPRLSFRRLYVILCERFNDHEYFIDDYFEKVYPYTMKSIVEERLDSTKKAFLELVEEAGRQTRITKGNKLDLRYAINKELTELGEDIAQEDADDLAKMVKEDIQLCLMTGIIPLNFNPSSTTMQIRRALGISSNVGFYATGQLIDDLRIFFRLERKQWQTQQGILV